MLVAFDLDGTLLDSSKRHIEVLRDILSMIGVQISQKAINSYVYFKADGYTTKQFLEKYLQDTKIINKINNKWISLIETPEYLNSDVLYPDSIRALKSFQNNGHEMVLLTARQNNNFMLRQVHDLRLSEYFSEIICVSPLNAFEEKTAALKKYQVNLMIGDSEVDWKSAIAAGVPYVLLNRGFRSRKFWENHFINSFNSLDEIVRIIRGNLNV